MIICPNCHHENAAGSAFCGECGHKLSPVTSATATTADSSAQPASSAATGSTTQSTGATTDTSATSEPSRQQRHAETSKTASTARVQRPKWVKWVVGGLVLVVLIAIGGLVYRNQYSKSHQVAQITQALADNNRTALVKNMVSDDHDLTITTKSVAPLMTYLKNHSQYAADAQVDLKHNGYTSDHTLTIVTSGRRLGLFPIYKLQVTTMHPKIETNLKAAEIDANGIQLTTTKYDHENYTAGPLMPGTYHFAMIGTIAQTTKTVNLMGRANVNQKIQLLAKTDTATKSSDKSSDTTKSSSTTKSPTVTKAPKVTKDHTGSSLTHLSDPAQTAVGRIADIDDIDVDDYTYTESEPHTNVYEIKLYDRDSDNLTATYRYDNVNDILAKYDQSTDKFVAEN